MFQNKSSINSNKKRKRDTDYSNKIVKPKKKITYHALRENSTHSAVSAPSKLSNLQEKFQKKLEGARFRSINESLYTTNGSESFLEFQKNPTMFELYHQGFRLVKYFYIVFFSVLRVVYCYIESKHLLGRKIPCTKLLIGLKNVILQQLLQIWDAVMLSFLHL